MSEPASGGIGDTQHPAARVAATTMVFRSPALLGKWIDHYGAQLGRANLFIIAHGPCADHAAIAEGCNLITIPRRFDARIDVDKAAILSHQCALLLSAYDGVICGDVDELVAVDPALGLGLADYVAALPKDAIVAPVGLNVMPHSRYFERPPPRVDLAAPLLAQCNRMSLASHFSKPAVLKAPARFAAGQHTLGEGTFTLDDNLALFHLKYLALNDATYYRDLAQEVRAAAKATGRPVRQRLWARGAEGLKEMVARLDGTDDTRVSTPREEARQLSMAPVSPGDARLRVVGPKRGSLFRLPPPWQAVL